MRRPRATPACFVLLELLLGIVILGVTLVAILAAFIQVMDGVRDRQILETAMHLAESMMADFELEPPAEGRAEGSFADDPRLGDAFEDYSWEYQVEPFEPRYRDVPRRLMQDIELVHEIDLRIYHAQERRRGDRWLVARVQTYLVEPTTFTDDAIFQNQVF
jgi:hypothetical protein